MTETRTFRMHVFESEGNRFAFTSKYSYMLDKEPVSPAYDASFFADVLMGGAFTYTGDVVDVPVEGDSIIFEHVKGSVGSPKFAHGSATVYYLSGPLFDECKAEEVRP